MSKKQKKKRYCIGITDKEGDTIEECGKEITDLHHNCKRCASCAKEQKLRDDRDFMNEKRKLGEDGRLGTSYIGQHMRRKKDGTPDWAAEQKAIRNEMQKMGLTSSKKKQFNPQVREEDGYDNGENYD